jgi:3-methylcrotonyl-CoA carboxylase beta subunit
VILMVEGTSFMGLGGANLVKGATGQTIDNETLGGAMTHNAISGVAHYRTKDEKECLEKIRQLISELPSPERSRVSITECESPRVGKGDMHNVEGTRPSAEQLFDLLPDDHKAPYDMHKVLATFLDGPIDEFQSDFAKEMICGTARIGGILVGVIANSRGMVRRTVSPSNEAPPPRFGGIVYTESAEKTAYFIENCNRHSTPLLFVQDVSGFMVGAEAEHSGIIRAGARFVEAMATATVPKTLPTGRMGVMEGDSAVQAIFGTQLEKLKKEGKSPDESLTAEMNQVRQTYDRELDAKHAAARGLLDAIVAPENLRDALILSLETCLNTSTHTRFYCLCCLV